MNHGAARSEQTPLSFCFADVIPPPKYGFPTRAVAASRTPVHQRVTVGPERVIRTAPLP